MTYRIADEPVPVTTFKDLAVAPNALMIAAMVCGAWLAWPWLAFNALALGSPTRRREIAWCGIGLAGTIVLAVLVFALVHAGVIESRVALEVALLAVTGWKLGVAYVVVAMQQRAFQVYSSLGGTAKNARPVISAGWFVRGIVADAVDHPLWPIIIAVVALGVTS